MCFVSVLSLACWVCEGREDSSGVELRWIDVYVGDERSSAGGVVLLVVADGRDPGVAAVLAGVGAL